MRDGRWLMGVGRARSRDGKSWQDDGLVLDVGTTRQVTYESEKSPHHLTGHATPDGWGADPAMHIAGFLQYGPYVADIPPGENAAIFRLRIGGSSNTQQQVGNIEVYDATRDRILALRTLRVADFGNSDEYREFELRFNGVKGNAFEFRTYWHGVVALQQDHIRILAEDWDTRIASFPGVLSRSVQSGCSRSGNPLLRHGDGWEAANIGTPSLYREEGTWYLFYHGYDWNRVQLGVATGPQLTNLTKFTANPILKNDPDKWDSGTVGRRSQIIKHGEYYYLAYEGSTDQPFETARWSTGLTRSRDLLHWEKFSSNPILSQSSGFGNDGPELLYIGGSFFLYVRTSSSTAPTQRYRLMPF
jgi:hypothetical protein